jgi:hypothetical protein
MTVLREDLLVGRTIALAEGVGWGLSELLVNLGASVAKVGDLNDGGVGAVVHDAGPVFGKGGEAGLTAALNDAWQHVSAAANHALIPSGDGGKVVLIAPRAGVGRHADAARAALENLARTLSIEWARYGITTTAVAPGASTSEDDVALLVAFVLSAAGDYFSGCRFELGAAQQALIRPS